MFYNQYRKRASATYLWSVTGLGLRGQVNNFDGGIEIFH